VRILTKYKVLSRHETYDPYTTACIEIEMPFGPLTVYGSIIGVFGNRPPRFDNDLYGHLSDFEKIFPGRQVCLIGDLNVTFSGQSWPSQKARQTLLEAFEKFGLTNTTASIVGAVDHIVLSYDLVKNKPLNVKTWNTDKKLSDHEGFLLTLAY